MSASLPYCLTASPPHFSLSFLSPSPSHVLPHSSLLSWLSLPFSFLLSLPSCPNGKQRTEPMYATHRLVAGRDRGRGAWIAWNTGKAYEIDADRADVAVRVGVVLHTHTQTLMHACYRMAEETRCGRAGKVAIREEIETETSKWVKEIREATKRSGQEGDGG